MPRRAYHIQPVHDGAIVLVLFNHAQAIEVWDVMKMRRVYAPVPVPDGSMQCALFGNILCLSGGSNGGIFAVDVSSGERLWTQKKIKNLGSLKSDEDRCLLFCSCGLGDLVIVDPTTGRILDKKEDFGEAYTRTGSKFLLSSSRTQIHVTSWPNMETYCSISARSFAVLDAEFSDDALIYSEVTSGITFARVTPTSTSSKMESRFVIDGHYDELGFWKSRNLFVGVDVTFDPHKLVMINANTGEVAETREHWGFQGFFVNQGSCILTRGGQLVSLEDGQVLGDQIFG